MTAKKTVPLRYGLQARYISHKEIAVTRRSQARRSKRDEAELPFDEEPK